MAAMLSRPVRFYSVTHLARPALATAAAAAGIGGLLMAGSLQFLLVDLRELLEAPARMLLGRPQAA